MFVEVLRIGSLYNQGKSQTCKSSKIETPHTTCHDIAEPLQVLGLESRWQKENRQCCPIST